MPLLTSMIGSIPINGMLVKTNNPNTKSTATEDENEWKLVLDDEARKINPLMDVNMNRNQLILDSIKHDDWSNYHAFEAKQHPAWYDYVDGQPVRNKIYYGNLIESKIDALKEARAEGDQDGIRVWERSLREAIEDFNNAPGVVPYIVGLNHNDKIAAEYGVERPADGYFDSKYNNPLVINQGKFETNMWYDNPVFKEDAKLKAHVEGLVADKFPTSESVQANVAKEPVTNEASNKEATVTNQATTEKELPEEEKQKLTETPGFKAMDVMDFSSFDYHLALLDSIKEIQESSNVNKQKVFEAYKYA